MRIPTNSIVNCRKNDTERAQGSNEKYRTVHELSAGTARINDHFSLITIAMASNSAFPSTPEAPLGM